MKYLFNTIHAINKVDYWSQIYNDFQKAKENPWYPIPVLENKSKILSELVNKDIFDNEIQISIEACPYTVKRRLSVIISLTAENGEMVTETILLKGPLNTKSFKFSSPGLVKSLHNSEIEIEVTKNGKPIYQSEMRLNKLKSNISTTHPIELKKHLLKNKSCLCIVNNATSNANIKVIAKVRNGCLFPHYEINQEDSAVIQFYPSFKPEQSAADFESETPIRVTDVNVSLTDQEINLAYSNLKKEYDFIGKSSAVPAELLAESLQLNAIS